MTDPAMKEEVSALARGLALLRAVADAESGLTNKELAESTGIPKATVSRLTSTLLGFGLLRQAVGSERFLVGAQALHLGSAYLNTFDFRQHARMHLAELANSQDVHVHLGVRDGLDVLLIDTLKPRSALILSRLDIGARMSIATSASGRAYLASLPEPERTEILQDIRRASGKRWTDVESRLKAAFKEHARLGFCTSFGEWHPDINALGFTLRGPREGLYMVSVGGPAYKLSKTTLMDKVAPKLLATREAINREAGLG
jgi:DNA-binding IclR family transcriptional regulator